MKFLKKDLDRKWFVIIVLALVFSTALTIYAHAYLNNLANINNKEQELYGGITGNAVIDTATISKTKVDHLEQRYFELTDLNSNLKDEIIQLKKELVLIKSQIEYQKAKDIGPTEQFRRFVEKNNEIEQLSDKIKELCRILKGTNATGYSCD